MVGDDDIGGGDELIEFFGSRHDDRLLPSVVGVEDRIARTASLGLDQHHLGPELSQEEAPEGTAFTGEIDEPDVSEHVSGP